MNLKFQRYVRKAPVVAVFFVSTFYTIHILGRFRGDTTAIFNIAVGITAALAGLCFAMAATLNSSEEDKESIAYSGERFFHSSLSFLIGAVLKYAALHIDVTESVVNEEWLFLALTIPLHLMALLMFLWAIFDAHTGLTITNDILWKRLYRDKRWDSIV
jgi:hypothetical protein